MTSFNLAFYCEETIYRDQDMMPFGSLSSPKAAIPCFQSVHLFISEVSHVILSSSCQCLYLLLLILLFFCSLFWFHASCIFSTDNLCSITTVLIPPITSSSLLFPTLLFFRGNLCSIRYQQRLVLFSYLKSYESYLLAHLPCIIIIISF